MVRKTCVVSHLLKYITVKIINGGGCYTKKMLYFLGPIKEGKA